MSSNRRRPRDQGWATDRPLGRCDSQEPGTRNARIEAQSGPAVPTDLSSHVEGRPFDATARWRKERGVIIHPAGRFDNKAQTYDHYKLSDVSVNKCAHVDRAPAEVLHLDFAQIEPVAK